jgi:NTP pyrophosphatase (non-canonical NTP hydrolase)
MTDIKDITEFQREFDRKHNWIDEYEKMDDKFLQRLQYATIAMAGEVGEFSNELKKILREKHATESIDEKHISHMKEELVDVFIYLVILSLILKVDITKEYFEKMDKNNERFKKFEK